MSEQNNSNFLRDQVLKENTEFELYALQLANMIRIRNNDFVCIFDEVGTGKTISAGLCIIELLNSLEKFQQLKVLIITKNSVLESFRDKLQDKLLLHINEEDFQNTIFNLELEDVDEERLCRSGLMEYKNSRLCISQFGIDTVEHFSIVCDKCGEIIFLNIFSPKNTCPKCGKIITPEYESTLCKDASFRGYRNTMI